MKTMILALAAFAVIPLSSCQKREHGVPNDPGASYQDDRTRGPGGEPVDGSKEKLLPKGAQ